MKPRLSVFVALLLAALLAAPLGAAPTATKPAAKPAAKAPAKPAAKPATTSAAKPAAATPVFSNAFQSPRNKERVKRTKTSYIILHTTEGAKGGALEKLSKNGECHYVVDKAGVIYRIVDRRRIAYHCGTSMWNGVTDLDRYAIGIEIEGVHTRDITAAQYKSLRYLIAELKRIYGVPDDRILTHSMVAYGTPNHWQKRVHRGRKRCGMLLADPDRRAKLGIHSKPAYDPDLKAGRLADADPELTRILYGKKQPTKTSSPKSESPKVQNPKAPSPKSSTPATSGKQDESNIIGPKRSAWDIAKDLYNAPTTLYKFPDGTTKKGSDIRNWKAMPAGTVVTVGDENDNAVLGAEVVGRDSSSILDLVGDEALAKTTFYVEPGSKTYLQGSSLTMEKVLAFPGGTRVFVRYKVGGPVSARRPVYDICGTQWNRPETYYLTPKGEILPGNAVKERAIPKGAWVFYRD